MAAQRDPHELLEEVRVLAERLQIAQAALEAEREENRVMEFRIDRIAGAMAARWNLEGLAGEQRQGHADGAAGAETREDALLRVVAQRLEERRRNGGGFLHDSNHVFGIVERGDVRRLREAIARGADVNYKGPMLTTPLMCACCDSPINARSANQREIVSMLIKAGAVVDSQDKGGQTALEHACEFANRGCVFALLRAGATLKHANPAFFDGKLHAIKKCGGWQRHVELHRGRALRIISACVGDALPEDVTPHVVDFWVPPGGY